MGNSWRTLDTTLQYGWQPDLTTPTANDMRTVLCERVEVSLERDSEEIDLLKGTVNSSPDRLFGGKSGTVTIRGPLHTFLADYDPTSDDALEKAAPEWFLIAQALGCGASTAVTGTAQAGAASSITLAAGASASDDFYNGWLIEITSGTGAGQYNKITDYVGASKVATVENAWSTTPDATSVYALTERPHEPSHGSVYDAGDVTAGSDNNTVVTTAGAYFGGELLIAATSATDLASQVGYVKTGQAAGGSVELRENATNIAANADNTYPTLTFYAGEQEQQPATVLLRGPTAADRSLRLIGCISQSLSFTLETRTTGRFELVMAVNGWEYDNSVAGLVVPSQVDGIPAIIGRNNGRVIMGDSGSADIQCGVSALAINVANEISYRLCASAEEGRDQAVTTRRTVGLSFTADFDSDQAVYDEAGAVVSSGAGSDKWESMIDRESKMTFEFEAGPHVSRIFSAFIGAAKVTAQPGFTDTEGRWSFPVTMEADPDTGDTTGGTAGEAANRAFKVAIG